MKRQIRRGVFETNSSSTHSITIINRKQFNYSFKKHRFIKKIKLYFKLWNK